MGKTQHHVAPMSVRGFSICYHFLQMRPIFEETVFWKLCALEQRAQCKTLGVLQQDFEFLEHGSPFSREANTESLPGAGSWTATACSATALAAHSRCKLFFSWPGRDCSLWFRRLLRWSSLPLLSPTFLM